MLVWETVTKTTARYVLHARLLWKAAPGLSVLCLLATAASSAAITAALITTGRLIGTLPDLASGGARAADRAWFWFAATAIAFAAAPVFGAVAQALTQQVSARYLTTTFDLLLEVGTHPYGVARFDDARFAGRLAGLHQAMRDWTFVMGVDSTWIVVGNRLAGVGALAVAVTWRWWAAAVLVVSYLLISKVVTTWINTFYDDLLDVTGNARREATYIRKLLTGTETGKEIRLFGLADFLIGRFRDTWLSAMQLVWRNRTKTMRPVMAVLSLAFVLNVAVFGLLARDALAGAVSVAALATLVQALLGLEAFGPIGDPLSALARNTAAAAELVALRRTIGLPDIATRITGSSTGSPGDCPGDSPDGSRERPPRATAAPIDLVDVGFTYPTRDQPAFERLTLHVPAGQSVGIVGVNGAGKSTLIKLLCGLYPPDTGSVRVGGIEPAGDEVARARIAVIFQDFVRYHLSVRDNIGFGAARDHLEDGELRQALADAGADGLLDRLDGGLDTVLSPEYADGTDLSGGQWQRVALARAFAALRAGAGVLVLDEPTAALDVRAEAALFDRFLEVTRGMTTLLVSHRLSSVRHADRIVVIGDDPAGESAILEDGSHEQLMAGGGAYARMFLLQASRFAAAGAEATR